MNPSAGSDDPAPRGARTVLLALTAVGLAFVIAGIVIWISGGGRTELLGLRIRATDPFKPLGLGVALLIVRLLLQQAASHRFSFDVEARAMRSVMRAPAIAAGLVVLTTCVALYTNHGVGGGSDSYGYVSQADLWLKGDLTVEHEWLRGAPWPHALLTATPLAYRPAQSGLASVPVYAPGLPWLLAGGKFVFGHCGFAIVIALMAGLLVAVTYAIGRRVVSEEVGAAAAWLTATSPILIFMMASPMSDIPAAALTALALLSCLHRSRKGAFLGGLAMAAVLVIRPNLAPLAAPLGLWLLALDHQTTTTRGRFMRALLFAIGVVPGIAAMAMFNAAMYESPIASGYGDVGRFFAASFIAPNIRNYSRWLIQSQSPLMLLGALSLVLPARWLAKERAVGDIGLLLMVAGGVTALYLPYMVFDRWWYLRFFLPAWPVIAIGTAWLLTNKSGRSFGKLGLVTLLLAGLWGLRFAAANAAFSVGWSDLRYVSAAHAVREMTPPASVILAMQHSGSVNYYGGRRSLRFDWIEPGRLESVVAWLKAQGSQVYVLLEEWEAERFRARFTGSSFGALPEDSLIFRQDVGTRVLLYDTRSHLGERPRTIEDFLPSATRCPGPAVETR